MYAKLSDGDLVEKCVAGEKGAWSYFVDKNIRVVCSAVYKTMLKRNTKVCMTEIQDVSQDVFLKLIAKDNSLLKKFNPDKASISTWLTVISRNCAIDHMRKYNKPQMSLDEAHETLESQTYVDPQKIDVPKGVLSARQLLVLKMMYNDGLDVESIALFLKVKRQTVRSLHHRALSKLRKFYGVDQKTQQIEAV